MDGYVIGIASELGADPSSYWDGHDRVNEMNEAKVYPTANEARLTRNGMQATIGMEDAIIVPVTVTIAPRRRAA